MRPRSAYDHRVVDEAGAAALAQEIAFEAFGVRIAVSASRADVLDRVRAILPPGWRECSPSTVERRYTLTTEAAGTYAITRDHELKTHGLDLDLALGMLDSEIRVYVGRRAHGYVFIHAGAVSCRGRGIVLPGTSFAGKTTLVAALVRAGAGYYSDEFAVLDHQGLLHPYSKPLSIRGDGRMQIDHSVESLGGVAGEEAIPVGMIVFTSYRPDAQWNPRRVSAGEGAMALLANAVPARERPAEVLRAVSAAAKGAIVIEGDRGEADAIASLLLAELDGQDA